MLTGIVVATAFIVVQAVRNSAFDVSDCVPYVRTLCCNYCEQMSKHNWNVNIIEEKIKEKIHERGGGTGHYQVLVSYTCKVCSNATAAVATATVSVLLFSIEYVAQCWLSCNARSDIDTCICMTTTLAPLISSSVISIQVQMIVKT
jgi:hypothetical protein